MDETTLPADPRPPRAWPGWAVWAGGWLAMFALDPHVDLASLALLLVLTSAVASLWWPGWACAAAAICAGLAFNWSFVPPRHTFEVDLRQHVVLLATMLAVNWIVSGLVVRQRRLSRCAAQSARRERRLRQWGDVLRQTDDPAAQAHALCDMLGQAAGATAAVLLQPSATAPREPQLFGPANDDQRCGLALCMRENRALGPGTGRHEDQPDGYLPLRGRGGALGAAVIVGAGHTLDPEERDNLQACCDQLGQALQRAEAARLERAARDQAHDQELRNALLAAVSHDYRTPLAIIMSAASSLEEQGDRLDGAQRRRRAAAIIDETSRLARLTDNTLQLVRLDAPGVRLGCDWESAVDIVGNALRHLRRREGGSGVRARIEPELPLLWCDGVLLSQLLDNLVDNALKYGPPGAPVEVVVTRCDDHVLLAVRDRGPGIAPPWRDKIFDAFRRGESPVNGGQTRAGAGVGLAVCRAIARAHGGELTVRARRRGGSSFECRLPLRSPPGVPAEETAT